MGTRAGDPPAVWPPQPQAPPLPWKEPFAGQPPGPAAAPSLGLWGFSSPCCRAEGTPSGGSLKDAVEEDRAELHPADSRRPRAPRAGESSFFWGDAHSTVPPSTPGSSSPTASHRPGTLGSVCVSPAPRTCRGPGGRERRSPGSRGLTSHTRWHQRSGGSVRHVPPFQPFPQRVRRASHPHLGTGKKFLI